MKTQAYPSRPDIPVKLCFKWLLNMMEILKRQPVSHLTGSQLGKADYDVNVAVEYRHQLQILIYDE